MTKPTALQPSDLRQADLTPADAQELWGISPGMFNVFRSRNQLPGTVVKAGKYRYTRFSVVQLAVLGLQAHLVQKFKFPQGIAHELANEAAVRIEQEMLRPPGSGFPQMPYVIVLDPPRWFPVGLDDTLASIDKLAGTSAWVAFDVRDVVEKTCEFVIAKAGQQKDYEKFAIQWNARGN